jgi:two-component system chemotaxis response regulator CheB
MVTASASREMQPLIFAALQAGVLAIVAKPLPGAHKARDVDELLWTVKSMAQVRVIRRWTPERLQTARAHPALSEATLPARPLEIVAIGASTGGPGALHEILTQLPSTFPLPILVVQHIGRDFLGGLIDWLTPQCALPIRLVTEGLALDRPGIYFAPHDRHLSVRGSALALTDDPAIRGHRPSATILFKAVAAHYSSRAIGVLLTGMGDDGATGLRDLKNAGGVTIAQDEASSVVFGMPAVAIALGIVDYMLPPSQIGPLLNKLAGAGREGK